MVTKTYLLLLVPVVALLFISFPLEVQANDDYGSGQRLEMKECGEKASPMKRNLILLTFGLVCAGLGYLVVQGGDEPCTESRIIPGTITQATTNQYQQRGEAACAHFAALLVCHSLRHPTARLHDAELLDRLLKKAASEHPGPMAGSYKDVAKAYGLKIDESFDNPLLLDADSITKALQKRIRELNEGKEENKVNAILQNGIEAWFLKIYKDGTIDIADSHTREGIPNAHIKRYASVKAAVNAIKAVNALIQGNMQKGELNDYQLQQSSVRIYWAELVKK